MSTSRSPLAERADLVRALGAFVERPTEELAKVADAMGLPVPSVADHTYLFANQLPPYASIYLGQEGGIGGDARDVIAGFWRAVGMTPPAEPDHLSTLLGLWAALSDSPRDGDDAPLLDHATEVVVWEHLASWLVPYLARVGEVAGTTFGGWAETLMALVSDTVTAAPAALPSHLALPPAPPEGASDMLDFVLAPIRSGLVLTRVDVARAASTLGLGMRIGERAYALQAMVDQDAGAVFEWLGTEAERQREALAAAEGPPMIREWWRERLESGRTVFADGYGDHP